LPPIPNLPFVALKTRHGSGFRREFLFYTGEHYCAEYLGVRPRNRFSIDEMLEILTLHRESFARKKLREENTRLIAQARQRYSFPAEMRRLYSADHVEFIGGADVDHAEMSMKFAFPMRHFPDLIRLLEKAGLLKDSQPSAPPLEVTLSKDPHLALPA